MKPARLAAVVVALVVAWPSASVMAASPILTVLAPKKKKPKKPAPPAPAPTPTKKPAKRD